jgi:hypothetical protein
MDQDQSSPTGLTDVAFGGERDSIRWALGRAMITGWTPADEELALRLYIQNPTWPCERAVEVALDLAEGFLATIKEEKKTR